MKTIIVITFLVLLHSAGLGQPTIEWEKNYGGSKDVGWSTLQTHDGGYLCVGTTEKLKGGETSLVSGYMVKTYPDGSIAWEKPISANYATYIHKVIELPEEYLVFGHSKVKSTDPFGIYVALIDANGNVVKEQTFVQPFDVTFGGITSTIDQGYAIIGNGLRPMIFKLAPTTELEWIKEVGSGIAHGIIQTHNFDFAIVGTTPSSPSGTDLFLLRTGFEGDSLWTQTYSELGGNEEGWNVQETVSGPDAVNGFEIAGSVGTKSFVVTTDQNGNYLKDFKFKLNGPTNNVVTTSSGRFLYMVSSNGPGRVVELSHEGAYQWTITLDGSQKAYDVAPTSDGGWIVTGYSDNDSPESVTGALLAKFDGPNSGVETLLRSGKMDLSRR